MPGIIVFMGKNTMDINSRFVEMNVGNKSELVAADVENRELSDLIGVAVKLPNLAEIFPFGVFCDTVPGRQ